MGDRGLLTNGAIPRTLDAANRRYPARAASVGKRTGEHHRGSSCYCTDDEQEEAREKHVSEVFQRNNVKSVIIGYDFLHPRHLQKTTGA